MLPIWVRVNLGAMTMKGSYHIQDTHLRGGVLHLCREAVGVFYNSSQLGKILSRGDSFIYNTIILSGILQQSNKRLETTKSGKRKLIKADISTRNSFESRMTASNLRILNIYDRMHEKENQWPSKITRTVEMS